MTEIKDNVKYFERPGNKYKEIACLFFGHEINMTFYAENIDVGDVNYYLPGEVSVCGRCGKKLIRFLNKSWEKK